VTDRRTDNLRWHYRAVHCPPRGENWCCS